MNASNIFDPGSMSTPPAQTPTNQPIQSAQPTPANQSAQPGKKGGKDLSPKTTAIFVIIALFVLPIIFAILIVIKVLGDLYS